MLSFSSFKSINKKILFLFIFIIGVGFYSFLSASFGILNRNEIKFYATLESQITAYIIGFVLGLFLYFLSTRFLYRSATVIYLFSIIISTLTFVPGIGLNHGGANRWINLFGFSLQPAEILKIACIIWVAYFFKKHNRELYLGYKYIFFLFLSLLPVFAVLVLQKDLGSIFIIFSIVFTMYFISNFSKFQYIFNIIIAGIVFFILYVFYNPYAMNRINTLIHPDVNSNSYYQTEQAYIAIAGGNIYGRGVFSGIQKYKYLPEPAGDSVFATFAEETGFVFSSIIIFVFLGTFIYIIFVSKSIKNIFEKYLILGISAHIIFQIIINIGSMVGIVPLSGDILPFFSQGGTSLIINLSEFAIILSITKVKDEDIIL